MAVGTTVTTTQLTKLLAKKQQTATAIVYSSGYPHDIPTADTASYVWVCDGTNDNVEIASAITAVAAQGGGKVQLLGDIFNVGGSIPNKTGVWVAGEGAGTIVKPTGSMTGVFTLADDTVHLTKLSDLTIDGNGRDCHAGVYYNADGGQVFTSAPSSNPDPSHTIDNLFIRAIGTSTSPGYGLHLDGANLRAGKYSNIRIQSVTGCGVWDDESVDSHYSNIEIGSSGSGGPTASNSTTAPVGYGFYMNGANNMVVNCKAWYSRAAGFYNHSVRTQYANCQAQDNYSHGFHDMYGKTSWVGCHADSNGQGGTAAGFYLTAGFTTVLGCQSYDRGGQAWKQAYGFQFTTGLQYSRVIGCVTYGNATASQTGTAGTGTTIDIQADSGGK